MCWNCERLLTPERVAEAWERNRRRLLVGGVVVLVGVLLLLLARR
ncbi:MAG: hypothetical protein ACYCW6_25850 [Candidatus Xenobia bacterium]